MSKPVDFDELYPGRFFKAGLLEGKPTYTIGDIEMEELIGETGPKMKGVVTFTDHKLQLPLNKTNGICIREMFGRTIPDWSGKRIALFSGEHAGEPAVRIWGSPDIEHDMKIVIALPRKKPFTMTMHATGKPAPAASKPAGFKHSADGKAYLGRMGHAASADTLLSIKEDIMNDSALSPEETQQLEGHLTRRKAQLAEGAGK